ncbi:hypothetical protein BN1708_013571 [Verticillium longisporum]|uniref:Alpha-1,4 glucan phosphorylase n=3 Tax=Hypocreomycetidae TaxID=222543 RepID=A0A0G4LLR9_VERLO|nr:hypothetical protein BN1708_013571 [Verticillium longisporum]
MAEFVRAQIFGTTFEITSRYSDLQPVGMGAFGLVCSARDQLTNQNVAVKKIMKPFSTPVLAKRTYRELKLLKHLRHENVISLSDIFISPLEDIYFVTELLGTDLHRLLTSRPLEKQFIQYFLYQIMRGLKYVHSAGVVHRDLKPSNILVNENCDLKICDFGLARIQDPQMTGYVSTRYYRAPEIMLTWQNLASLNYPAWGYGLRYRYGIFKQEIIDGYQVEVPDYWLDFNPWEFPRHDVIVDIQFYGHVNKSSDENGKSIAHWEGGETVQAVAYDVPIPGYATPSTNNLRLWSSKAASGEFDFQKFNSGDYESSVADQQRAETISAVLYPNDNLERGKELRLKQQYFWVAASLYDIVRRFKKTKRAWKEFPDQVAIQLNDTHPTLAIVELQRILIDLEKLEWDEAWDIVTATFGYTNHTVLPEALEKWSVGLIQNLLPRHLQIIYDINLYFLQAVEKKFPGDRELLSRVSIIEESQPKMVRMAYLAVVGSHKVNGVAELHSDLIKTTIFKDFVNIYGPDKFTNVTNAITPRRWLHQANPRLSDLIAARTGSNEYLKDLTQLNKLEQFVNDKEFRKEWAEIKYANKVRLAKYIKSTTGVSVNPAALFDVQVKRIHEYKRQQMNIFDIGDLLKVIFLEDYNVSKAEMIIPASDLSEHISTAGTEASGTSNMKFVLNGGLIIGTCDGANIEITREIGENNIFLFGNLAEDVEDLRYAHNYGSHSLDSDLVKVFAEIEKGTFGSPHDFGALVSAVRDHGDYYLTSDDFHSYIETHALVDESYKNQEEWITKTITSVARMGFFSSDRCINEYAEEIWNIEPLVVDDR